MKINEMTADSNNEVTQDNKHVKTSVGKDGKPLRIGTGLPGPGRPKKAMEDLARQQGQAALKKKYGTLEKAFIALLESKEPSLIRLAFEYALGKPAEIGQAPGGIPFNQLTIQVVQTNSKANGTTEHTNNQGISIITGQQEQDSSIPG